MVQPDPSARHPEVGRVQLARRFRKLGPEDATRPYLAIYEVEADDIEAAFQGMMDRARRGEIPLSEFLQLDPPPIPVMYEEIFSTDG